MVWPEILGDPIPRVKTPITPQTIQPFDKDINFDQKQFLVNIINNSNAKAPFLLFGPFGKTHPRKPSHSNFY